MNGIPLRACETIWAKEAAQDHRDRPSAAFRYRYRDPADKKAALEEGDRVAKVKAQGKVPEACSREILNAPARGGVDAYRDQSFVPDGDGFKPVEEAYRAGCPGRTRDVFDIMTDQGTRRGGLPPFTAAQVGAGREYRALVERLEAAGINCSKAFDPQGPGRGGTDFMDAFMADRQRLAWFQAEIGEGIAKSQVRKVPATVGKVKVGDIELRDVGKRLITVRALVDAVCLADRPLSWVLKSHGWSPSHKNTTSLRDALCSALGRMQGI